MPDHPAAGVTGVADAFHVGLGINIGVYDLPPADVGGTDDLPPVFTGIPPLDPTTVVDWAHLGYEVALYHRLSPEPLAQAGLVDTCTCGQQDELCPVRRLMRHFGLSAPIPVRKPPQ